MAGEIRVIKRTNNTLDDIILAWRRKSEKILFLTFSFYWGLLARKLHHATVIWCYPWQGGRKAFIDWANE